jgi:hypothetical protein
VPGFRILPCCLLGCLAYVWCALPASAQPRFFAGGGPGAAFLSNDAGASITSGASAVSTYRSNAGLLAHAFAGWHFHDYLSVQGAWNYNRNRLRFSGTNSAGGSYDQLRSSTQDNAGVDLLVYFRDRRSWIRPFLTCGLNYMWFESRQTSLLEKNGVIATPPDRLTLAQKGLRVAAGADVRLHGGWGFRYAFNEILQGNGISRQLTPAGSSPLMNFQHLFGIMRSF